MASGTSWGGIYHRHKAEEGEALFHTVDIQLLDTRFDFSHGHSQDPIGLVREGLALRHDALMVLLTYHQPSVGGGVVRPN